jgi:hypothetical protein
LEISAFFVISEQKRWKFFGRQIFVAFSVPQMSKIWNLVEEFVAFVFGILGSLYGFFMEPFLLFYINYWNLKVELIVYFHKLTFLPFYDEKAINVNFL